MKVLRSLFVVVLVLGGFVFLGQGWRSATTREEQLKEQLAREHLMRIGDSVLHNLRQVATPNKDTIVNLNGIVWEMCFGGGDVGVVATPFSTVHIKCAFTPRLGTYHELIQDLPSDYQKLNEHLNMLLINRQVDVTARGYENSQLVLPTDDDRGKDLEGTKFFDPVVVVKFQMHTRPITNFPTPVKDAAWIKFTEPTYEFPTSKKQK